MQKNTKLIVFAVLLNLIIFSVSATDTAQALTFCEGNTLQVFKFGGIMINLIKVLVPIVIILLACYELFKAVVSGDDKDMSAAIKKLTSRFIAGIVIFLLPSLLLVLVNYVDGVDEITSEFNACTECLLSASGDGCGNATNNASSNDDENTTEEEGSRSGSY